MRGKTQYEILMNQLDSHVGRIIAALKATGEWRNTIVVFLSDNGAEFREGRDSNYPFFGKKNTFYEGGVRTPLIVKPAGAPQPRTIDDVVSLMDIYPSLIEWAGVDPIPGLKGRSLTPALEGKALAPTTLFWENTSRVSVLSRDGRWRLLRGRNLESTSDVELFDLRSGIAGYLDVAAEHAGKVDELTDEYASWFRQSHRVHVASDRIGSGEGVRLTGNPFLRSPGGGPYSFGLAFRVAPDGSTSQTLVEQSGVWSLRYTPKTSELTLDVGSWKHKLTLAKDAKCHSVLLSTMIGPPGEMQKRKAPKPGKARKPKTRMTLYVDATAAVRDQGDSPLPTDADLQQPTWVGQRPDGSQPFTGRLSRPILLSARIGDNQVFKPAAIHTALCSEIMHQATRGSGDGSRNSP